MQRFAIAGSEVRIFRGAHYYCKSVENLPDLRTDMRFVARDRIEHVGLSLNVAREFGDHALVDKFGHRRQVEKARLDLCADTLRAGRKHPTPQLLSAACPNKSTREKH